VILDTSIPASDIGSSGVPIFLQGPNSNPVNLTAFTGGGNAYIYAHANGGTGYTGSVNVAGINLGGTQGNPTTGGSQSGALSLQADGDITVSDTASIQTYGNSVNLTAAGDINVNGSITATLYYVNNVTSPPAFVETSGSTITLDAGGSINLNAAITATTGSTGPSFSPPPPARAPSC
jgi:hypothetical protein